MEESLGGMDTIVLALGTKSQGGLAKEIEDKVSELYVIGDAQIPGKAMEAIAAGAEIGRQI
jgi:hypothetical protein